MRHITGAQGSVGGLSPTVANGDVTTCASPTSASRRPKSQWRRRTREDDRFRKLAQLGIKYDLVADPRKEGFAAVDAAQIARVAQLAELAPKSFKEPSEYNKNCRP